MKRFSEQFHKKSKSITLSSTEKKELQERLFSYMEYHPLPAELQSTQKKSVATKSPVLNDVFTNVAIPFRFFFKSAAVFAVFTILVVPFLAEQTVPGDTLYAVKVQFNEELRGTLTFDSVDKVEWETERLNRRIAEARLLESEGRLTDEMEAEVAQAVRTHSQNAQKEIALLREQDAEVATIASIEFDSTLEAQASSFLSLTAGEPNVMADALTTPATKIVNLIADAVDESRALNEQPNASSTPSYEKLMARVEQNTTRIYELRDSLLIEQADAEVNITRRVEDIERSITQAITLSVDARDEAQTILVDVLRRTQKLIVFMTDLEVTETVDIQKLVPVVLTNDEEIAETEAYQSQITEKRAEIAFKLLAPAVANDRDFEIKIESGLSRIDELMKQITSAADYAAVEASAKEALTIANDALLMMEQNGVAPTIPLPTVPGEEASTTATTSESEAEQDQAVGEEIAPTSTQAVSTSSTTTVDAL